MASPGRFVNLAASMHIYWFAYYDRSCPSVRYRGLYPLEKMGKQHGITCDMVFPGYRWRNIAYCLSIYCQALLFRRKQTWIVIQKLYTRGLYATALKCLLWLRPSRTIYDLDDAEYLRHHPATIQYFLRKCSQVHVGSRALQAYCTQWNSRVRLLTSPVIPHGKARVAGSEPLRLHLGWVGFYNAHRESMEALVFPALESCPHPLKLTLLGVSRPEQRAAVAARFQALPHVTLDMPHDLDWEDEAGIYARICHWDLGLAPLLDTAMNRAKSAFKLKQCLSCGVPVLASPVGENVHFLQHGVNGWLFSDAADLQARLSEFMDMQPHDRAAMRVAALRGLEGFSLQHYVEQFLEASCQGSQLRPTRKTQEMSRL